jgi:hypothetical protein
MPRHITNEELDKAKRFGDLCPVYKIDNSTIAKFGDYVRFTEAEAMRFVRQHTDVPVPEVFDAYRDEATGHVCIVMEFVEGDKLEDAWALLSKSQKGMSHEMSLYRLLMKEVLVTINLTISSISSGTLYQWP